MTDQTKATSTQCVGRFQLTVPAEMVFTGRSQSIYRVDVTTLPIPQSGVDTLWDARLNRIRVLKAPGGASKAILKTFELAGGYRAVWYYNNPDAPQLRTLEAMRREGDFAVLAVRSAETGKEPTAETLVKNVLDAYVPQTAQGFCLGHGAITSEPGLKKRPAFP